MKVRLPIRGVVNGVLGLVFITGGVGLADAAAAQTQGDTQVAVDAVVTGYWDQFGKHIQRTTAYEVGIDGRYNYHNFLVFDLSDVAGTITEATLLLENPVGGFNSVDAPLTLTLVDVATSIDDLTTFTDRSTSRVDIWEDLGGLRPDSQVYGEYDATADDDGQVIAVALNDTALADLNAAIGGQIAIGGSITNLIDGDNPQELFGGSGSPRRLRQLLLSVSPGN